MKIIAFLTLLMTGMKTHAQKSMRLEVNVSPGLSVDTLFIVKGINPYSDENLVDSFVLFNNKGQVRFQLDEASYYILRTSPSLGVNLLSFIAEPGKKARIDWTITGPQQSTAIFYKSRVNKLLYEELANPSKFVIGNLNASFDSIYSNSRTIDSAERVYFRSQNKFWGDSLKRLQAKPINLHPKEYLGLFMLSRYYADYSDEFVQDFLNDLPKKLQNHSLARELAFTKFTIEKIKRFSAFELKDTSGQQFDYAPFANDFVLVDFWASWCKPCLANIPKVDSLGNKYASRGLKVLGVSIDENREAWINAVRREKIPWPNVHEPLGTKGISARVFKISTIPRYVLLGRDGVILNKNLNLTDAEKIIEEALEEKNEVK